MLAELLDRYGEPPEETRRLAAIAKLRLRCRERGVAEIGAVGTNVKISPLHLLDSEQVRLKRLYSAASYRATTSVVTLRSRAPVGSDPRVCATTNSSTT